MYNMGDVSYITQPKIMSSDTVGAVIDSVYNHCKEHSIEEFLFGFHGGEPLLAGKNFIKSFVKKCSQKFKNEQIRIYFTIQTNGTLLSDEWCKLLSDLNVHIGISIDGNKNENDKFRVDHSGRGSYDRVVKGIENLKKFNTFNKQVEILSVINIATDPIDCYNHMKSLGVKKLDFLLPYFTYDSFGVVPSEINSNQNVKTIYGDWLIKLFDAWVLEEPNKRVNVRLFDGIISSILGNEFPADLLGEYYNELLVIETDGGIEAVDALKICGNNFTKTGKNILRNSINDALETKLANLYFLSHKKLCSRCQSCPIRGVCGGGYLPHRYSSKNGFNNPSIFCHDLLKLITHIQTFLLKNIPRKIWESLDITPLSYNEALKIIERTSVSEFEDYSLELESF